MRKRLFFMAAALCFCLSIFVVTADGEAGQTEPSEITVFLDGKQIVFDVPPQTIHDRTMVPMRAIFEALGATVDWNEEERSITSTREGITIFMVIDNPVITVNGEEITLDVAPVKIDDRTLVPIRAVAESFEAEVLWNEDAQRVDIKTTAEKEPVVSPSGSPAPSPSIQPSGSPDVSSSEPPSVGPTSKPAPPQDGKSYGFYEAYPDVPDFGDFTQAGFAGSEERKITAATDFLYRGAFVQEEDVQRYADALEENGFAFSQLSGYSMTCEKGGLTVTTSMEERIYRVRVDTGEKRVKPLSEKGYYTTYPTVPDFGEYTTQKLEKHGYAAGYGAGGYIYLYGKDATREERLAYTNALKSSFSHCTSGERGTYYHKENIDQLNGQYNTDNISVFFGESEDGEYLVVRIYDHWLNYTEPSTREYYRYSTAIPDLGYVAGSELYLAVPADTGWNYYYRAEDIGKFKVGDYIAVLQRAGFSEAPAAADSVPGLAQLRDAFDLQIFVKDNRFLVAFGYMDKEMEILNDKKDFKEEKELFAVVTADLKEFE